MRILTWNINGVRTIPQYHPWNTMKTHDDILNLLQADIICFQEMKTTRQNLPKAVGLPPSYHSFFSFPLQKNGYSGVAVYARTDSLLQPLKAEEGLSGVLQPKPPLSPEERVSRPEAYPDQVLDDTSELDLDFPALDSEGRALVIDFGLLVLINLYCPNDGGDEERFRYKMDFHRALEARVRGLVEIEHREVLVVGDLNACAGVLDHAEGSILVARAEAEGVSGEDAFYSLGAHRWLRDWLISDEPGNKGCLVDVVRRFWPERKGMYTCWNTKISARESNYGTRIDYILATPGLLPWIKAANIQPELKGSDHCPVFVDLHDEIIDANGVVVKLRDVVPHPGGEPPRIAAKFWDEYKQRKLDAFFGKKVVESSSVVQPPSQSPLSVPAANEARPSAPPATAASPNPTVKRKSSTLQDPPVASSSSKKLKKDKDSANLQLRPKAKKGQTSLASFFSAGGTQQKSQSPASSSSSNDPAAVAADTLDADYKLALSLSQESDGASGSSQVKGKTKNKQAWTSLLAPIQPPRCLVHGEPAKELTVNKPGPNKGKMFFVCARPVGPGYDRGRAERPREEVDPQWKCDFFKWSSEVRLEMKRKESESG
ncbi:Endonuclease/exonuclease/phosphatase [Roridomyces roridus]|uniref:DNA-(apurinic or apyrimidinic site) endonuclease 2 n=1 Tax=Roridomyces roridus TaxID=1738132 RepID=A0AAD7FDV7_9AGAR|nr:Endonuclease/exonuclease/phosphatase [Roridomyces roridus]